MSVLSNNIFDMLEDDADGTTNSVKAPAPPKPAPAPAAAAAPAKKPETRAPAAPREGGDRGRGGRGGDRGRGGRGRGDGERRPYRGDGERGDRGPRERREGGEGEEGERRTRRYENGGPRRDYNDRHSHGRPGSEDKRGEKRDGRGPHNWGDKKESGAESAAPAETPAAAAPGGEAPAEAAPAAEGAEAAAPAAADAAPAEEAKAREPEEVQYTMEEYKKQKEEARAKLADLKLEVRKAGEGEDAKQWQNTKVLKKDEEVVDPLFAGKEKQKKAREAKEGKKIITDVNFHYADADQGRDGGRGRGRGRGGDGRGRGRGEGGRGRGEGRAQGGRAVAINDAKEFPTLGGK